MAFMDEAYRTALAEGVHFGEDAGGFGFELVALGVVVGLGVFAGAVLEVEVAEVVVYGVAALAEVVEARFFYDCGEAGLWPEDVGEAAEGESDDGEDEHDVMKRMRLGIV